MINQNAYYHAHQRLTEIGVDGNSDMALHDRVNRAGDRLTLRPEGEPDTADLVGKINELCDRVGVATADPVLRVSTLAYRCEQQAEQIQMLQAERDNLLIQRDAALADLDAERAQLAKPQQTDAVKLALLVLEECDGDGVELALAVVREALQ